VRQVLQFSLAESRPRPADVLESQNLPEEGELSARARGALGEALRLYAVLADPRAVFEGIAGPAFGYDVLNGEAVAGSVVSSVYPRAEALALFAATIGEPVCLEIRRLFGQGEVALGYMLDTVASVAAERLADLTAARFRDTLAPRGSGPVRVLPYSPGYCGWPTTGQGPLFEKLRPGEIGISLNDSFLMWPLKSVSGVLVAGPLATHTFEADFPFCNDCATQACQARLAAASNGDERWTS
jgi:cobalamin-dependent methionine synthase-like protein